MAAGWALRKNGTCASDETNCGMKARPFYGCCPEGTSCPDQYNIACCPESGNCTLSLLPDPQCANREWDLYDNNGFFCCLKGLTGYSAQNGRSSGCAEPGYRLSTDERFLSIVSSGTASSTATPTDTPGPASAEVESSSSNTGAIVGGVIGGLAALAILAAAIWFLLLRRRKQRRAGDDDPNTPVEAPHSNVISEKDARPATLLHEKDANANVKSPVEMPETSHPAELAPTEGAEGIPELPASEDGMRSPGTERN